MCYRSALGIKCLLYRGSVNGLLFFSSGLPCHTNQSLARRPINWTIRHYLVCCDPLCYANHKSPMNDSLFGLAAIYLFFCITELYHVLEL